MIRRCIGAVNRKVSARIAGHLPSSHDQKQAVATAKNRTKDPLIQPPRMGPPMRDRMLPARPERQHRRARHGRRDGLGQMSSRRREEAAYFTG